MKKIAILIAAFIMSAPAFAQLVPGAGYLNGNFSTTKDGKVTKSARNGFYAGASYQFNLSAMDGLSFVPGAYFAMVSANASDSVNLGPLSQSATYTFTEMDLMIPAYFKYLVGDAGGAKVYLFAGPTVQYGLSAKNVTKASGLINGEDTDDFYAGDTGYNRLNVYIGGGIGMGFKNLSLNVGYDYGMMNIFRGVDGYTGNRSNLHVGVSFAL